MNSYHNNCYCCCCCCCCCTVLGKLIMVYLMDMLDQRHHSLQLIIFTRTLWAGFLKVVVVVLTFIFDFAISLLTTNTHMYMHTNTHTGTIQKGRYKQWNGTLDWPWTTGLSFFLFWTSFWIHFGSPLFVIYKYLATMDNCNNDNNCLLQCFHK